MKGQVVSGGFGKILAREKSSQKLELGELLITDTKDAKILLQVYDLIYGSQVSQQNLELISGINLEENTGFNFMDAEIRNYNLALMKNLITISENNARICKNLPSFFSTIREVKEDDLNFLTKPKNPLFVGKLRSGSKTLNLDIFLPGDKVFSHHILIPGTTGRGKSVLLSNMLWGIVDQDYCGILVLDPHDEYYGRNKLGLKDHPKKENIAYYTPKNPPTGTKTLKINITLIKPSHFNGVFEWSQAQKEALTAYYKSYKSNWIENIILERKVVGFTEATIAVIKRRLLSLLNLEFDGQQLYSNGVFDLKAGLTTIKDISDELEQGKIVIIDTSSFSGATEILIGSLVATEILNKYKNYKIKDLLKDKPVISIILEEAPRVLGKDVLENGPNIFSTIAREGRKFKVGLTAITQLPSLIPREILANMNTKIILGIEMQPERQAIIESASQDLSEDNRNIASLDIGEAIITSTFTKFATPVKIPLFDNLVKNSLGKKDDVKKDFSGIKNVRNFPSSF
ncbi:MAG: ATP-binding protein [Nanoarchaeota archaeon]|nr:ATP-binding protein [Nanoarchaeota archaeon]